MVGFDDDVKADPVRLAYLFRQTDPALITALTARDVVPVAHAIPQPQDPSSKSGWFGKKPGEADGQDARVLELLGRALEEGITHYRVPPDPVAIALARGVTDQGGPRFSVAMSGPKRDIDREDLAATSFITVPSYKTRAAVLAWLGRGFADRVHVIPYPIDLVPLPTPRSWTPSHHAIVLPSGPVENGTEIVLDVLKKSSVTATIIAADAALGDITREVKKRQMTDRVAVVASSDKAKLWEGFNLSSVAICPALISPHVPSIIDAMAFGRPVIAPMIGDVPELLDATCGWLIRPGHVGDLDGCLSDAITADPRKGEAMSAECRRRILAAHDAGKGAEALLALIRAAG